MTEQIGIITGQLPEQTRPIADMRRDYEPIEAAPQQTLSSLAAEFAFFTTGLMHIGGFDRDPVSEYFRVNNITDRDWLLVMDFDEILFPEFQVKQFQSDAGGVTIDYRRRLYACPHERWMALRDWISRLSWYRRSPALYGKTGWTWGLLPDVTSTKTSGIRPVVSVTCFAVITNKGSVHMANRAANSHPVAVYTAPDEEILSLTDAVLSPVEMQ